jgi:autotransporter translocation and assembly factor TamB
MRRKILFTISIFFILVITLLVGAFFFTQTQYFRNFVKRTAESVVSSTTGQVLTIGALEGNFFNDIKLSDVSFVVEGEDFVTVKEISLDYSIPHMLDGSVLLSKIVPLDDLSIKGLDVNMVKYPDGTWNFSKIGKKKEGEEEKKEEGAPPDWSIILKKFLLTQGEIKIDDRESGKLSRYSIPEIDLSVNLTDIYREVELDLRRADVYATEPELKIEGLSTKAYYSEDKAGIENLTVLLNGSEIKLNAEAKELDGNPKFSFDASASKYELKDIGTVSVNTRGSGEYIDSKDLRANASISIPESELLGKKVSGEIKNISVNGASVAIEEGNVKSELGEILISGSGDLSRLISKEGANNFNLDVSLKDVKTNEVFSLLQEKGETEITSINTALGAVLNANLSAEANWVEFSDITVKGNIENIEIKGQKAGDLKLTGSVEYSKPALGLDISSSLNKVDLSQILNNNTYQSNITSELDIVGQIPLEGNFMQSLSAQVKGEVKPSSIFDIDIKSADLNVSLENEFLDIRALSVISDKFTLNAEGNRAEGKGVDFSYELKVEDLSFITDIAPSAGLTGSLEASGDVMGEIDSPKVSIDLKASDLSVKDGIGAETLTLKASGVVDLDNPELDAELAVKNAKIDDRQIESIGVTAASDDGGIRLDANIVQNEQFQYEIDTIISELTGREKKIEITDLKLNLEDSKLDNRESIGVTIAPEQIIVENFNLYYDESSALANVNVNFDGRLNVDIEIDDLSLDDFTKALGFDNPVQGTISANLSAQGTMEEPEFKASVRTQGFGYEEFEDDISLDLSYLARNLNLKFLITDGASTLMDASGSANVDLNLKNIKENINDGTFNLSVNSTGADLSPVASLSKEIDKSEGTLTVDLRASGSFLSPRAEGEIRLNNGIFKIKSLRNEFAIPSALIQMNGQRGSFNNLEIGSGKGTGVFNGEINLAPLSYKITGSMDHFTVKPNRVAAVLSGDIEVDGNDGKIEIGGKIKVNRSNITIPDRPDNQVEEIQYTDDGQDGIIVIGEDEKSDFFTDSVGLDLGVKLGKNNRAVGHGANIEFKGDLKIDKKPGETVRIVGDIQTTRGTIDQYAKQFRIELGTVSFAAAEEINPFLNIRALYKAGDVNVYINVGGRARSPEITFSSDPPLTQTEIVSYLVFGTSSADRGALGSPQLQFGRYLTKDLYVAYSRSTTQSIYNSTNIIENKLLVEYHIFRNLTLDADVGGENPGADLFYNFNF